MPATDDELRVDVLPHPTGDRERGADPMADALDDAVDLVARVTALSDALTHVPAAALLNANSARREIAVCLANAHYGLALASLQLTLRPPA